MKSNHNLLLRCDWAGTQTDYQNYHDTEWGIPNYDSLALFEFICLEGQQAGLSWYTILKKRHGYRTCFQNFNPEKIIQMNQTDIARLILDSRIIRNKLKIQAIINNAKAYLELSEQISFADFIWQFVDYKPIINHWNNLAEVPSKTEISTQLSRALKQKGFKFIGSTTCYAFMQACGLVNDHLTYCHRHPNQQLSTR